MIPFGWWYVAIVIFLVLFFVAVVDENQHGPFTQSNKEKWSDLYQFCMETLAKLVGYSSAAVIIQILVWGITR